MQNCKYNKICQVVQKDLFLESDFRTSCILFMMNLIISRMNQNRNGQVLYLPEPIESIYRRLIHPHVSGEISSRKCIT